MDLLPYVIAYIALGIFIIAVISRFFMWLKMPMHMRWELYPVAHEAKRASYGGSYLEDVDWWKKPRESSLMGELKVMIPEILFLVALKEHNKKLWVFSFPFHFGLYLVIGATFIMLGRGVLAAFTPELVEGGFGTLLQFATMACGFAGLLLSLIGAVGLLIRRLTDADLKDFTAPADIFNLVFFIVAFGVSLGHALIVDAKFERISAFIANLVSFQMLPIEGPSMTVTLLSIALLGILVAYIPMTHMSHFIGKYFAYHSIRWNDSPNVPGSEHEKPIGEHLQYPVSWAAPHINGEGKKTWADLATEEVKK